MPAIAAPKTIKIGFVTPLAGPLAVFAEPDAFVLEQFRKTTAGGQTPALARCWIRESYV